MAYDFLQFRELIQFHFQNVGQATFGDLQVLFNSHPDIAPAIAQLTRKGVIEKADKTFIYCRN